MRKDGQRGKKSRRKDGHGRSKSRHKLGQGRKKSMSKDGPCRAMLMLKPMNMLASALHRFPFAMYTTIYYTGLWKFSKITPNLPLRHRWTMTII